MKFKHCIIDLDPICYRAGFSIQKMNKDTEILEVEPISHALYNVNSMIKGCLEASGTQEYTGYLTGKGNFRFDIFKYYKENRVRCELDCGNPHPYDCHEDLGHNLLSERPFWYKEIREFLVDRWKAKIVEGEEADDACSILQYSNNNLGFDPEIKNSIVWSIDKDFNNFPGWHGNYVTKEIYYVDELQALRNFYLQILTGDTSDGIPRIKKGWRQKEAEKSIKEAQTETELSKLVGQVISDLFPDYTEEEITKTVQERGRLVWLRTKPNEMWGIS